MKMNGGIRSQFSELARMKVIFVLYATFGVLAAQKDCYATRSKTMCMNLDFKINEPLQLMYPYRVVSIQHPTGSISIRTLSNLTDMEEMLIFNGNISYIEDGALCSQPDLQVLRLSENFEFPILTESLLRNCQNIKKFQITGTKLEPTTLKHMPNLEILYMTKQNISHFTIQYLESQRKLKSFTIYECNLETIDPGVLCNSPKLEALRLEANNVFPPLSKALFKGCDNLETLKISPPRIMNVEEEVFFNLTRLKQLEADNLTLNHLTKTDFGSMNLLEELYLRDCYISEIDIDAFEALKNLKLFHFVGNNLTNLDPAVFANLINLRILDLSSNNFNSIDNFLLPNLEVFVIERNAIFEVDINKIHSNLPKLKELYLSDNPMSSLNRKTLIEEMSKLNVEVYFSQYKIINNQYKR